MKSILSKYLYLGVSALIMLGAVSCVEGVDEEMQHSFPNDNIVFRTSIEATSRSASDYHHGYLSVVEEELSLTQSATRSTPLSSLNGLDANVTAYIYDTWTPTERPDAWSGLSHKKFVFKEYQLEAEGNPVTWKSAAAVAGDKMRIYAVSPYNTTMGTDTLSTGYGYPTISHSVPTLAANQNEILVAYTDVNRTEYYHDASLDFQHALTAVRFKMGFAASVESLLIEGINSKGTMVIGNKQWTCDTEQNYEIAFAGGKSIAAGAFINDGGDIYMMIPQILGTNARLTLTYDGGQTLSADLSGLSWEPGRLITYTLNESVVLDNVQYFDLAAGNVDITPSGFKGYIYVNGVVTEVSGAHNASYMYYIYQSSESQTATNKNNTGWKTTLRVGECRVPTYPRVKMGTEPWSEYITNNTSVEGVIEAWDNEQGVTNAAGSAGAVRNAGRQSTPYRIKVGGNIKCNITIDNLYSTFQVNTESRVEAGIGFIPTGSESYLNINIVGDNRFGAIHYSNLDPTSDNEIRFNGTGSMTVADVNYYKSSSNDPNSVYGVIGEAGYYGNHWAAAIGNNDSADKAYGIVFNGGVIFAGTTKIENCSAIGGGGNGHTSITINGGDITAVASTTGTAIGGGIGFNNAGGQGTVTINGGNVYAYNFANRWDIPSSAIGGAGSKARGGNTGIVTITGGNVYAQSAIGTAIGGGSSYSVEGGNAIITITGGHVVAKSVAANSGLNPGTIIAAGAGIGGGAGCTSGSNSNKNGGSATINISNNPIIRTGSVGGGKTNSPGGKLGTAQITVSGGDIQAQFIMENTGSGLESDRPKFDMSGGVIRNSDVDDPEYYHVQRNGGAVYMGDGTFTMTGGIIKDCNADKGGAVYIKGTSAPKFNMTGGSISGCVSTSHGGAIYLEDGTVSLGGTGSISNCEGLKGGAIYILKTSAHTPAFTMTAGSVSDCKSHSDGGAVYLEGGVVTISGGSINDNLAAGGNGGGVSIATGNFKMPEGGTAAITHNTALYQSSVGGDGGGIYVSSITSDVTVDVLSGSITNNTADRVGGGLCVDMSGSTGAKADVVVGTAGGSDDSPMISHNMALNQGGGLYVIGEKANIEINSGTILNNTTSMYVANQDVANELGTVTLLGGQVTHVVVTFHGNGGYFSGAETATQNIVTATNSVLVQPEGINRAGYNFLGWHTRADGNDAKGQDYYNGDTMNISESLDLYAQWELM